ncbi:prolyl oligopeptidase, partial [Paragonimus westermani]
MGQTEKTSLNYPRIRRNDLIWDIYFGCSVPDPYRWLEEIHSPEFLSYCTRQMELTERFLSDCTQKSVIKSKLEDFMKFNQFTCPIRRGETYFWCEKQGKQRFSTLCKSQNLDNQPTVLLNPTQLDPTGKSEVVSFGISPRGKFLCYELREKSAKQSVFRFIQCDTGEHLPDILAGITVSSMAWTHDELGLFYTVYTDVDEYAATHDGYVSSKRLRMKYHYLGTEQSADVRCHRWSETSPVAFAEVTHCGRYLLVTVFNARKTRNKLYYFDLQENDIKTQFQLNPVVETFDARYIYVHNNQTKFIILTDLNAPMFRLMIIDLVSPICDEWMELIPEDPEAKLEHVLYCHENRLVISRLKVAKSVLTIHSTETGEQLSTIPIPVGRIKALNLGIDASHIFLQFTSFNTPSRVYEYSLQNENSDIKVFRETEVPNVDLSQYVVEQIFYESLDKTTIPMFLVHNKDFKPDGSTPCKLTAFGGFGLSNTPSFSASDLLFLRHYGGILAVANIRGGGEHGSIWHEAGKKSFKQISFDDLISAAECLLLNKYTNVDKLFIEGRENGALVAVVCAIRRPDLFRAVIADNPIADMVRFYKYSATARWSEEYGNPRNADHFETLIQYSPVHTTELLGFAGTQIPDFLILTDPKSSKVEPVHSFKLTACLQHEATRPHVSNIVLNWISSNHTTD